MNFRFRHWHWSQCRKIQQYNTTVIQVRHRVCAHVCKRLRWITAHLCDDCDRVTGRVAATETGAHQQITRVNIGVIGDVRQGQTFQIGATDGEGAQAGTIKLDLDCLTWIGDESDRGRKWSSLDDLTDDAVGVQQGLAFKHSRVCAFVDNDHMSEWIHVHCQ